MTTTLYLIRHAQSQPVPHMPDPEWNLSPHGHDQARRLAPILSTLGLTRLYSSPYRRCQDTVRPFAAASGLDLALEPGLRERRIASHWVGDFRDMWKRSWEDFSYALEGGESSRQSQTRITAAVRDIARRHPGETIGLCSHGNVIALLLNHLEPSFGIVEATAIRNPDIHKLEHESDRIAWRSDYRPGNDFDAFATHFSLTPGVKA